MSAIRIPISYEKTLPLVEQLINKSDTIIIKLSYEHCGSLSVIVNITQWDMKIHTHNKNNNQHLFASDDFLLVS